MRNEISELSLPLIAADGLRTIYAIGLALLIWSAGCGQQAAAAVKTQHGMVGMLKERVLACMGMPSSRITSGSMEVLRYHTGSAPTNSNDQISSNVIHVETSQSRICKIDITLIGGRVSKVQYSGLSAAYPIAGKQCAYATENCLSERPGPAIYSVPQPLSSTQTAGAPVQRSVQQHSCTHEELVQARIAKMNGYTGGPRCN